MKLNLGKELFDEYAWKARALPVLVLISPATLAALAFGWLDWAFVIISLLASFGLIFLLAQLTRSLGTKLEIRLAKTWDGMPTTHMLRFSTSQNGVSFKRRRQALEDLLLIKFPTKAAEQRTPDRADEAYIYATKALISKVRSSRDSFPRVHEENINYGFRRNLLGLKPLGLVLNISMLVVVCYSGFIFGWSQPVFISMAINIVFIIIWTILINKDWVLEAANSYSNRLFEVLDEGLV